MTNFTDTLLSDWHNGFNHEADRAMARARDALIAGDLAICFAEIRQAMIKYGWQFHSDLKARRLWTTWVKIEDRMREPANADILAINKAVTDLFHATVRAVLLDRDRKKRRNLPPRDPSIDSITVHVGDVAFSRPLKSQ